MECKDGFLVIYKERGCTSHDCVKQIRRFLSIKKVGHTGTLDPEVQGVLPIAVGTATRFIQYLPQGKTYIGQIQFGIKTTTDDIHGEILKKKNWPKLNNFQLESYLDNFRGNIRQVPPKVSSVHINGERAYKKTLRGEEFELLPREVNVKELKLIKWDQKNGVLKLKISCSTGTYIRSIARDLGKLINSEGCLLTLKRTSACGFFEKNSVKISELINLDNSNNNFIIPTISALSHLPTLILTNEEEINFWRSGRTITFKFANFYQDSDFNPKEPIKIIDKEENLLGIGFTNEERTYLYPKLVLNAR